MDFLKHLIDHMAANQRTEISRTPITVEEAALQAEGHRQYRKLKKEADAYIKGLGEKADAFRFAVWDLVAKRHGYADNKAAIEAGVHFEISGDEPDEDEADERVVIMSQDPEKTEKKPKKTKADRFTMPN